ncbi:MAG TPA: DEAD/DEAH box helicase [Candidatus Nanoarchaeia archaeon]|nr:DEAD/DEAH box helicase [Candidatus Nanoarchaeia archaeon]
MINTKGIVLQPDLEKAILDLGFEEFTEIQEKCIPMIQQGKDVIGLSHTGSGKTAAFGFPALEKVMPGKGIQLLVLVPTRELCNQVAKEFRKFTKYRKTYIVEIYGGISIGPQFDHLRRAEVVVGTPGRTLDHLARGTMKLNQVKILVLDEADKMFEMGFIDDIKKIISQVPRTSQKLLFSATMSADIMSLAKNYMNNPERVKMQTYVDKSKLIQHYFEIPRSSKFSLMVHLLRQETKGLIIVFCGTRHIVDSVSKNLYKQNIKAEALHGGMTQNRRKQVMDGFRDGKIDVLVASDVAARGLDVKNVNLIVNYDIPKTSQEYVHRIGRTARAGEEGRVFSLLTPEDYENFRKVLEDRSLFIHQMKVPQFQNVPFVRPERRFGNRFGQRGRDSRDSPRGRQFHRGQRNYHSR